MSTNIINETNDNEDNSEDIKVKRTRNRLTKKQQFVKEREQIIAQLNNILGINEKSNTFYLYDVLNSQEIKDKLKELSEEVKKYFKCGSWHYFIASNNNEDVQDIALIRCIYKDEGYVLTTKVKNIIRNNNKVRTVQYYLMKDIN